MKKPKTRSQNTIIVAMTAVFLTLMTIAYQFLSTESTPNSKSLATASKPISIKSAELSFQHILAMQKVQKSMDQEFHRSRKLFSINSFSEKYKRKSLELENGPPMFAGDRIVHFDLKGAPVSMGYFKELFPLLRTLGATGVLMEYEDMFPYSGQLIDFPSMDHIPYSKLNIQELLTLAEENGLQIIPLIQTFGHMEFILKHRRYAQMRESPSSTQSICPSHNDTFGLITEMVDQIMAMHPNIRYLHIGCDEVRHLGMCERCSLRMSNNEWSWSDLFLSHVTRVAKYIKQHYPDVHPLIWDDHLRKQNESTMRQWNLAELVKPVIWEYYTNVSANIPPYLWDKYANVFSEVWIASAYKGATGETRYISNISYHLENHHSWMKIVNKYKDRLNFKGIMMTGWQRYNHSAPLCELLPVAIPSLAVNLAYLQLPFEGSVPDALTLAPPSVVEALQCDGTFALTPEAPINCNFPGNAVLAVAKKLYLIRRSIGQHFANSFGPLGRKQDNFLREPWRFNLVQKLSGWISKMAEVEQDMAVAMDGVFDNFTRDEWIKTMLGPAVKREENILKDTGKTLLEYSGVAEKAFGAAYRDYNNMSSALTFATSITVFLCGLIFVFIF